MKTIRKKCPWALRQQQTKIFLLLAMYIMMLNRSKSFAQNTIPDESLTIMVAPSNANRTLFGGKITNSGYGGVILKLSSFNGHSAFMTGGRGAITINKRYTIGGGGYGIANSIDLSGTSEDTSRHFKMGYGGLESGYIMLSVKKVNIGISLLIAAGAAFWQNDPKSNSEKLFDDDFNIFPVLEQSLYGEVVLNRFMWLHAGISYRYIHHAHLDYMTDQNMRGFSCYIGLLFGKPE
jgi:hypothetical protein